jgi:hypothetical protein
LTARADRSASGDHVHHGYAPPIDADDSRPSVKQTIDALVEEGKRSAKAELSLLRATVNFVTDSTVHAVVWLTAAAMLGMMGVTAIAVVAVLALNRIMALLPAVSIVAFALVVLAIVCVVIGRSKISAIKLALGAKNE